MEEEKKKALKTGIDELVTALETAANITRSLHAEARETLSADALHRFESLSLSVCYDLLEASDFDGSL